jgi:hypothetical protein
MHKSALFVGLSSVLTLTLAAGFVVACSSTTTTTTDEPVDSGVKETGTTKDSAPPVEDEDSGDTTDPDTACANDSTLAACGQCCTTNHTAGATAFQNSLIACACSGTGADGGTGPCATECATSACATPIAQPDATCSACLQGSVGATGACTAQVTSDCEAVSDCIAEQQCISQCQGKP